MSLFNFKVRRSPYLWWLGYAIVFAAGLVLAIRELSDLLMEPGQSLDLSCQPLFFHSDEFLALMLAAFFLLLLAFLAQRKLLKKERASRKFAEVLTSALDQNCRGNC